MGESRFRPAGIDVEVQNTTDRHANDVSSGIVGTLKVIRRLFRDLRGHFQEVSPRAHSNFRLNGCVAIILGLFGGRGLKLVGLRVKGPFRFEIRSGPEGQEGGNILFDLLLSRLFFLGAIPIDFVSVECFLFLFGFLYLYVG